MHSLKVILHVPRETLLSLVKTAVGDGEQAEGWTRETGIQDHLREKPVKQGQSGEQEAGEGLALLPGKR